MSEHSTQTQATCPICKGDGELMPGPILCMTCDGLGIAHLAVPRTKTGSAYTTDDGQHVPEHALYAFDCSCGHRAGVWYASEKRAHRSWERHTQAEELMT